MNAAHHSSGSEISRFIALRGWAARNSCAYLWKIIRLKNCNIYFFTFRTFAIQRPGSQSGIANIHWKIRLNKANEYICAYLNNMNYFLINSGPTLSPVSLLWATWLPSQYGKVLLFQHRHITSLPSLNCARFSISPQFTESTTFGWSFFTFKLIGAICFFSSFSSWKI